MNCIVKLISQVPCFSQSDSAGYLILLYFLIPCCSMCLCQFCFYTIQHLFSWFPSAVFSSIVPFLVFSSYLLVQSCHFDLTLNLIDCEKKSEYTEKSLNLTAKTELLYSNLYQNQSQKNLNLESGYLNFSKFQEKNLNDLDKI